MHLKSGWGGTAKKGHPSRRSNAQSKSAKDLRVITANGIGNKNSVRPGASVNIIPPGASVNIIPLGRKRSQMSINNRGRMVVIGRHLTDLKNTTNNRGMKFLTGVEVK